MKKIILSLFMATSLLVSCSDAYDVSQPGYVTDEAQVYNTPADIARGVTSVYYYFPGESEVQFTSFFTDELGIGINNGGQGVNDGTYTFRLLVGDEKADDIWGGYYSVINRVNRMLFRIDDLYPTASVDEKLQYDTQKAHLLILRAYSHFKLFAFFTPDYTKSEGLSVIKFNFLQTDDYKRFEKRATVGEIVAFIEEDLAKAKSLGGYIGDGTGFASDALSDAVLVKLYSMLQTQSAYDKLEVAFVNLVKKHGKALANYDEYAGLFSGGGEGSETIFKLNRVISDKTVTDGIASEWYASVPNITGNPYMEIGRSLYNELDKLDPATEGQQLHDFKLKDGKIEIDKDGFPIITNTYPRKDARYTVAVLNGSIVNVGYENMGFEDYKANDVLLIGKYTGLGDDRPLMNDVISLRFTDMLLSLAEKRAFENNLTGTVALGDYSNVESIIFNIRSNRNEDGLVPLSMPTNFSSPQQAYARILEERRIEFAFEGQRYLDMKRLGVRAGSPGFVRHAQDCAPTGACALEPSSTKLTLPIPRAEIMANPNMVQNPGY